MARFIAGLSQATGAPAIAPMQGIVSDPTFTHWVVEQGRIVGEAHSVEPADNGTSFAFVRLFNMPREAEYGYIESDRLQAKNGRGHA